MYGKFNEEMGIPTHAAGDGTELTKTSIKMLKKEKQKYMKALAKW